MNKSVITNYDDLCLICNGEAEHHHHCLSGKNRNFADRNLLIVPLCGKDHNLFVGKRPSGWSCDVHHCPKLERLMKCLGQMAYEKQYIIDKYSLPFTDDSDEAREAFRRAVGESFL